MWYRVCRLSDMGWLLVQRQARRLLCWAAVAWSGALQRAVHRCTGPAGMHVSNFASADPVECSPCASAPSARADRTGIGLEICGTGQDSRGQQPLLGSQ